MEKRCVFVFERQARRLHLILRRIQLEIIASSSHAVSILKFPKRLQSSSGGRGGGLKMAKYCALAGDKF